MPKKLLNKTKYHRKVITRKRNIFTSKRGRVSIGMIGILLFVAGLSITLGLGRLDFSQYGTNSVSEYSCCDSGDGAACKPNTNLPGITYNGNSYSLLKSNVLTYEVPTNAAHYHLAPVTVGASRKIFVNTSDHTAAEHPPNCIHDSQNPTDFISEIIPGRYDDQGRLIGQCVAIPDDILIYVCRPDNNPGDCNGPSGTARFDVYMRTNLNEPVPSPIANCVKPPVPLASKQKLINLPSPTGQQNLQLETFYVKSDVPRANWVTPYCKPAVYLYPTAPTSIHVSLDPALPLTYTDPQYPQGGWDVYAAPTGDITYQQKHYDYLYYETKVSTDSYVLPKEGYVVASQDLGIFLPTLVTKLGLNVKETEAFVGYWEKALPKASYYEVKVVEQKQLDSIDPLLITPKPDTVIRVTLHFKALDKTETLAAPVIQPVQRSGFTVVEWGGMFERDANHPFSCLQ